MEMIAVEDFVHSGIFKSGEEVIRDALRHLTQAHPEYRTRLALYQYQKREISVGKAAELAGVSFEQMKEILIQRGIRSGLGPETIEEVKEEYKALENYLNEQKKGAKQA
jgi:predicted HTH domain antitoxin